MIPARRSLMRLAPTGAAQFVGTSVNTSGTGSVSITKPAGTQAGDYMMIFCPYSGGTWGASTISSGSDSGWSHDSFNNGHGYQVHCFHKKLTSADAAGSITVTGVSYPPLVCAVYRGPGRALKITEREDTGTIWNATFPRGKFSNSMGWVQWVNDRNGGTEVSTVPAGWTKRTGPNATGVFTGELSDSLNAPPSAAGNLTWSNFGNGSGYIRSGYIYEFVESEALTDLFYQPVIADKTYSTAGTIVPGSTSFAFGQDNVGVRGSTHLSFGSTAIYEVDITAGSAGTNIGMCTAGWFNAWKSAYPSSVPGAGGGIYWTTSQRGVGLWYGGGTHQSGSETGTTAIQTLSPINPSTGSVVGIVMNGRNVRGYLNGVFKGELALHKDSAAGAARMGGEQMYPFVGQWGSNWAGSFRATPSSYFSSYTLTS